MPFSVALLHYTCPPVVGGVEEIVRQQASLFRRNFHPVKVFAGDGGPFSEEIEVEINPILGSRNPEVLRIHRGLPDSSKELRRLSLRILRYFENALRAFDVLIAHNVLTMPYNLPLTRALHSLAHARRIPVVSWNHDSPYFYSDVPAYLHERPWTVLKKRNPNIDYVCISETRRLQFQKVYRSAKPLKVIPDGIDPIRFFRLDPASLRVIQEERLFEVEFIMIQPSRLHPRKNIELSIRVLRALKDRSFHARLVLTGAYDPHEERTRRYHARLIRLAGELGVKEDVLFVAEYVFASGERLQPDRITMRDLYLVADLLFLPSREEGFGIPLLEAGMIKLPILCADIPPFREIGGEDVEYFSLDESPEAIAERIMAMESTLKPHRMHRRVVKNYVWDTIYHRTLRPFLEEVLRQRRGA